jgi:L-alanine-DL-glutamate epimerase-like enolase superfamily enzyme
VVPLGRAERIDAVDVRAYTIPTDGLESDGTLEWSSTMLVVCELRAGGERGLGYSYVHDAAARVIADPLRGAIMGKSAFATGACHEAMLRSIRNHGRPGLIACAISAVDVALWDLKAKLLGAALSALLGQLHERVPIYGSGGFTSYDQARLQQQLGGWVASGIGLVKMKVGREPSADPGRVAAARDAIGPSARLLVDANGAYSRKQALALSETFSQAGVEWFEEPVSSDDLEGLRLIRNRAPAGMAIAAGEYGYDEFYFQRMLDAEAVDVLQPDATRCLGITGFLKASALCDARGLPLSSHCAPALHLPVVAACRNLIHLEYFHDHDRIERMLFDGVVQPVNGALRPDSTRPGLGLELRRADAERFAA